MNGASFACLQNSLCHPRGPFHWQNYLPNPCRIVISSNSRTSSSFAPLRRPLRLSHLPMRSNRRCAQGRRWQPVWPTIVQLFIVVATSGFGTCASHMETCPVASLHRRRQGPTPLVVTNLCSDTIHPGIITQSGEGPGMGGFELNPGSQKTLSVSENWQGRVWGRSNCSFTGASGRCGTGDCGGVLDCIGTGNVPVTLAEFTLDAGDGHTYYDISLVDGYNLPMGIVLRAFGNQSLDSLPSSLTNPSCVATGESGTSTSQWCPWNLQLSTSNGPNSGVYIYPDGNLNRPVFNPCYSACSKWNDPKDCCTGQYNAPSACAPSQYSKAAKLVCPDAYSYAFDDQTSTFIIPAGAGFEVIFCPASGSTNIIATMGQELLELAQQGHLRKTKRQTLSEAQFHYIVDEFHNNSMIGHVLGSSAFSNLVSLWRTLSTVLASMGYVMWMSR